MALRRVGVGLQLQLRAVRHYTPLTIPKLFVSGLSRLTTQEKLREAFSPFGNIVDVTVVKDRMTQRSKGFGFVSYKTMEQAERARHEMNAKYLDGWVIFVDPALPPAPRHHPLDSSTASPGFTSNKTIGWSA